MGNSTSIFSPQVRVIQPAFVYKEKGAYIWENVNNSTSIVLNNQQTEIKEEDNNG